MTSLDFFEQVERELSLAKREQAAAEAVRGRAVAEHRKADKAAQQIDRYVSALEDALEGLNSSVGRISADASTGEKP